MEFSVHFVYIAFFAISASILVIENILSSLTSPSELIHVVCCIYNFLVSSRNQVATCKGIPDQLAEHLKSDGNVISW